MTTVSIIVPTRNRNSYLSHLLEKLLTIAEDPFIEEVLVINNGSTDSTMETIVFFQKKNQKIRFSVVEQPGLLHCRNQGIKESRGEILCFLEDDTLPTDTWLSGLKEAFLDHGAQIAGGNVFPLWEESPPAWMEEFWNVHDNIRNLGYLSLIDMGKEIRWVTPGYIYGCNFCIRKELLLECQGFHPDTYPQDLLRFRGDGETGLAFKISSKGIKALHHPKLSIFHHVPKERLTLEYFCRRAFLQGISDSYTDLRAKGGIGNPIRLQIRDAYKKGIIFHREEVLKDNELLGWVLRENYLPGENEFGD